MVIFGLMGACRRQELQKIKCKDVKDLDGTLLVQLYNTKNKLDRSFTITGNYYVTSKKYMSLRPIECKSDIFFLRFAAGKCFDQNVGINTFGAMGKTVANYLNLPNPHLYTGHCFRRTSATILIDSGADITDLKRHGGWKSTNTAEGYIDNSVQTKIKVANQIMGSIDLNKPSTSTHSLYPHNESDKPGPKTTSTATASQPVHSRIIPSTSHSPTFTPEVVNEFDPSPMPATPDFLQNEINMSQILKQNNTPIIITKNTIQNLHIHYHK